MSFLTIFCFNSPVACNSVLPGVTGVSMAIVVVHAMEERKREHVYAQMEKLETEAVEMEMKLVPW